MSGKYIGVELDLSDSDLEPACFCSCLWQNSSGSILAKLLDMVAAQQHSVEREVADDKILLDLSVSEALVGVGNAVPETAGRAE